MELFGISFISLLFGIVIGKLVESARWRKNANDIVRIYSAGHLYKVFYDDPPETLPDEPVVNINGPDNIYQTEGI